MVGVSGKDSFKVSLKKTLTQNDGFKTLEIIKNAERGLGLATQKTIADIFVRDSVDEAHKMLGTDKIELSGYKWQAELPMFMGAGCAKFFDSVQQAIGQIQRKLQTQDYRGREHLIIIVRHAPDQWSEKEYFSVYQQDRQFL